MQPLPQALAPWHDFYLLLGGASATLTGLLFVAVSVGAGVFSQSHGSALRMFLSASVVGFSNVIAVSLVVLAPLARWQVAGGIIAAAGLFGLIYSALAWRDAVHDGVSAKIDLEDRCWYALAPAAGYLVEAGAGLALTRQYDAGFAALAVAISVLLLVAIHNAWDITVWCVTRQRD